VSAYEVFCHRCRVTAPPDRRRCFHCGGPLSPRQTPQGVLSAHPLELATATEEDAEDPQGELARRMKWMSALVWVVLGLSVALARACF
jgi:hypothetical protein